MYIKEPFFSASLTHRFQSILIQNFSSNLILKSLLYVTDGHAMGEP